MCASTGSRASGSTPVLGLSKHSCAHAADACRMGASMQYRPSRPAKSQHASTPKQCPNSARQNKTQTTWTCKCTGSQNAVVIGCVAGTAAYPFRAFSGTAAKRVLKTKPQTSQWLTGRVPGHKLRPVPCPHRSHSHVPRFLSLEQQPLSWPCRMHRRGPGQAAGGGRHRLGRPPHQRRRQPVQQLSLLQLQRLEPLQLWKLGVLLPVKTVAWVMG